MMRAISTAFLLLSLVPGCTGFIGDDEAGPGGSAPGGGLGPAGTAGTTGQSPQAPWMPPADGSVFTGPIQGGPSPSTRFARLTHAQWERTVQSLLGLGAPLGLSSTFLAEPLLSTFDNDGSALSVSADHWLDYQRAAEAVGKQVAADPQLTARFLASPPADATARARAFIETFGLRAYRRPLNDAEITRLLVLFQQGPTLIPGAEAFAAGVELVVAAMLQSAHFLYRGELSSAVVDGRVPLSDYERASRLSYGLLGSMPDDALFTAAGAGELRTRDQMLAQATRLLATPAASDTIGDFHAQLLHMQEYAAIERDDPRFGDDIGAEMRQEAVRFTEQAVLQEKGTLSLLFTASYTFGNSHVAELYGDDVMGARPGGADTWQKIELNPARRAGFMTQIGFLAVHGEGTTPNTIMRGVNLSRRVLCVDLPPPPDMIPPLPALSPDQTNRERVEVLTGDVACVGCHGALINPLGFALEHFDGMGQYRDSDNGQPVNAAATYTIDGAPVSYDGAVQFAQTLAASNQANECYARRWAEFLYGRDFDTAQISDQNLILQGGALSKGGAQVTNLITQLVATDAFSSRLP
jgi:hypothetical protein